MKINKLIIAFLSVAALFTACTPEEIGPSYPEVKAEPSYVSIANAGGSQDIVITTTGDWTITNVPEWLSVSQTSGAAAPNGVKVTLSALKGYEAHSVELKVNVGNVSQTVVVDQPFGEISPSTVQEVLDGVDGKTYLVQGIAGAIINDVYGNFYLTDDSLEDKNSDGVYVYGMLDASGAEKNFLSLGIEEGDEILISGPRKTYSGTIELENATLVKMVKKALLGAKVKAYTIENKADTLYAPITVKGEDMEVVSKESWLEFKGLKNSEELILVSEENTTTEPRTAEVLITSTKGEDKSEMTITVKQLPAAPEAKKASEINYSGKEYVTVKGTVAALTTSGFVLYDGNETAGDVSRVFIETTDLESLAIGAQVTVIGASEKKYARNKVVADKITVDAEKSEFVQPEATVLDKTNAATVMKESPAKYGYYAATGFLGSNKKLYLPGEENITVTAIDPVSSIVLKNYYGKYVTFTGYYTDNNSKYNEIQLVLTSIEDAEGAPADFLQLPYVPDNLDWNETEASISVVSTMDWTVSIDTEVEGVYVSRLSGSGSKTVDVIFAEKNNSFDTQTVVITVKAGETELDYTITRYGKDFKISDMTIEAKKQDVTLTVEASLFWKIELLSGEGATINKTEGYGTDAVILSVPKNTTEGNLTYKLRLTEDRVDGEPKTCEATITQKPLPKGYAWTLAEGDLGTSASPAASVKKGSPELTWTVSSTSAIQYLGWNSSKGVQIGSSGNPIKGAMSLATTVDVIDVSKIVVNASMGSGGDTKLSVYVNGTKVGETVSVTTTANDYTFTLPAVTEAPEVKIELSNTAKAAYIKSIVIE